MEREREREKETETELVSRPVSRTGGIRGVEGGLPLTHN